MEENIIECKNLTHYYGKRLIYENLNFSVKKGHIMGLLGKNLFSRWCSIDSSFSRCDRCSLFVCHSKQYLRMRGTDRERFG